MFKPIQMITVLFGLSIIMQGCTFERLHIRTVREPSYVYLREPAKFSLERAIEAGNLEEVKVLIEQGISQGNFSVNQLNEAGESIFQTACRSGHPSIIAFLLTKGANANLKNKYKESALYLTIASIGWQSDVERKAGYMAVVNSLLAQGLNLADESEAFYEACKLGDLELVSLLIQQGIDIEKCGGAALYIASEHNHPLIVKLLCKSGVDVKNNENAFCIACQNGHKDVAQLLINEGVNIKNCASQALYSACDAEKLSIIKFLVEQGVDINQVNDVYSNTPLVAACQGLKVELVECLIANGANVNLPGSYQETPLGAACRGHHLFGSESVSAYKSRRLVIIQLLIKHGADINNSILPLLWERVCELANLELVSLLIQKGVDVNIGFSHGETPLFMACKNGNLDFAKLLVEKGANVHNAYSNINFTPEGVNNSYVLSQSIVPSREDNKHVTPLMIACEKGYLTIVQYLLQHKVEVNRRDDTGKTALHMARQAGHGDIVKELLQHGALED